MHIFSVSKFYCTPLKLTCATGGFGSYILAMSSKIAHRGDKGFQHDIKDPRLGWMIGFLFVVSFLGLFSVVPLRKVGIFGSP